MVAPKEIKDMNFDELVAVFERESESEGGWSDWNLETSAHFLSQQDSEGIRYLLGKYEGADSAHTQTILVALSALKPAPDGLIALAQSALNDPRPPVQYAAIKSLTLLDARHSHPQIAQFWTHESEFFRSVCFEYFAFLLPQIAIERLDFALDDPSWRVRSRALNAVNFSDDRELINAGITRAWKLSEDPHFYVRDDANWLLQAHHWEYDTDSDEILRDRTSPDPYVRASAIRASLDNPLEDPGGDAPEILAAALADPERVVRLNALDTIYAIYHDNRASPSLDMPDVTPWLEDADPVIRQAAEAAEAAKNGDYEFYIRRAD